MRDGPYSEWVLWNFSWRWVHHFIGVGFLSWRSAPRPDPFRWTQKLKDLIMKSDGKAGRKTFWWSLFCIWGGLIKWFPPNSKLEFGICLNVYSWREVDRVLRLNMQVNRGKCHTIWVVTNLLISTSLPIHLSNNPKFSGYPKDYPVRIYIIYLVFWRPMGALFMKLSVLSQLRQTTSPILVKK